MSGLLWQTRLPHRAPSNPSDPSGQPGFAGVPSLVQDAPDQEQPRAGPGEHSCLPRLLSQASAPSSVSPGRCGRLEGSPSEAALAVLLLLLHYCKPSTP